MPLCTDSHPHDDPPCRVASFILWRRGVHAVYVLMVLFVTLWPRRYVEAHVAPEIQQQHPWIHGGLFFVLAVLSLWAYGNRGTAWRSRILGWLLVSLLGVLLEGLQGTPWIGRSRSTHDMRNNALGAAIGVLALPPAFWPPRRTPRNERA